jgi:hypothetical protein
MLREKDGEGEEEEIVMTEGLRGSKEGTSKVRSGVIQFLGSRLEEEEEPE